MPKREETTKETPWPRLTKSTTKAAWIKPDFDRMEFSDDEEEEAAVKERVSREYLEKITADIEQTQDQIIADLKKNYLFSYSLFQLLAISFIAFKVIWGLCRTPDYSAYEDAGTVLIISQIVSFLEVAHPMFGLVKTSFIPPLIQTLGRNLILLVLVWNEPELQNLTATNYLFLFWSIADVIRHPFYMLSSMKIEVQWVVWLRYTAWILLYPLGAGCEWIITWHAIPLFKQSEKFSMTLPNIFNFSWTVTYYLYLHLLVLPIGLVKLMMHMASLRRKKIGGGPVTSKTTNKKTN